MQIHLSIPTACRRTIAAASAILLLAGAASAHEAQAHPFGNIVFGVLNQSYSMVGALTLPNTLTEAAPGVLAGATYASGVNIRSGASKVSDPSDGAVTVNDDGSFSYTPNAGFFGTDSFTFTAVGAFSTATATIAVAPPVNANETFQVAPGGTLNLPSPGILGSTAGGQTAVLVTGPSNASSFTLANDGSFSYTPSTGFSGTDSFSWKDVANGTSSLQATVNIVVEPTITVAMSSPRVYSGGQLTGTITVSPAPTSDLTINLLTGNSAVATVDAAKTILSGGTSVDFTLNAGTVASATAVSVNAQDGGIYYRTVVTVLPAGLNSFVFLAQHPYVQGGLPLLGLVGVSGPPGSSVDVSFASGNSTVIAAPAPVSVSVPSIIGTFVPFTTYAVPTDRVVSVAASSATSRIQRQVLVLAPRVQSLSFDKSSISSFGSATLTINLTGPAPADGTTVNLTGVLDGVSVSGSVTIVAGQSSTTVTETAPPIGETAVLTVFAKGYASSAAKASITVTPAG